MKIGLVITAAGKGHRFGSVSGKQFYEIDGRPLILRTCERFEEIPYITQAVITMTPGKEERMRQLLAQSGLTRDFRVVTGGGTRKESVQRGIETLMDVDVVMVHDGARPFVSEELILRLIQHISSAKVVIPGIPVVDTVKRVENGIVVETPDRSQLMNIQTPQLFHYDVLKEVYAASPNTLGTDEASLVESLGYPVSVVAGDTENIKVTYHQDTRFFYRGGSLN